MKNTSFLNKVFAEILSAVIIFGTSAYCFGGVYAEEADEDGPVSEFLIDFESYETKGETVEVYQSPTGSNTVKFVKEFSGNAGSTNMTLKSGESNPFKEDKILSDEGGMTRPSEYFYGLGGNYTYKVLDKSKFVYGGLDGYVGINSINSWPIFYPETGSSENRTKTNAEDLTVINNDGNKELVLNPIKTNSAVYSAYSMFGKENLNLLGNANKISVKVKIEDDTAFDSFRLSLVKNPNYNSVMRWQNYEFMNYNNQFYINMGTAWYDSVTFVRGKIYLGDVGESIDALNNENAVCDYETNKSYTVNYYLNLTDTDNPMQMVYVYDESDNLAGKKANKIGLNEKTITTLNKNSFYNQAIGSDDRAPTKNSFFKSFDSSKYGVMMTAATGINAKVGTGARVCIDDFSMSSVEEEYNKLDVVTPRDEYIKSPISFSGSSAATVEFNIDLIDCDLENSIEVVDADGNTVECTKEVNDGNKLVVNFEYGVLKAASNYYIKIPAALLSAMGRLGEDVSFIVKTKDNISIKSCSLDNGNLKTKIENNLGQNYKVIVIAAIKNADGTLSNKKIYYKAADIASGQEKEIVISELNIPKEGVVEVFYVDSFGTLHAQSDLNVLK